MGQITVVTVVGQDACAEREPDDVACLEVISETRIRLWSVSFRLPVGWWEQAWLDHDAWLSDPRFDWPRSVLRELVIASPNLPKVCAVRLLADLTARGVIEAPDPGAGFPVQV